MALKTDPTAPRKKYLLVKWIRAWNDKHPADRITYAPGFDPETEVIGTPARETLKKAQRIVNATHVDGQFDRETMDWLIPEPGIRRAVMARAHGELGMHEWPANSNNGEIVKYLRACGIGSGNPWCAAFVTWCLKHEGVEAYPPNPAYVPSWHAWARTKGLLVPVDDSKSGDLWIWWRDQHIGFCDDSKPGDAIAYGLDGNVGAYGGSVTHVTRTKGEVTAAISLTKLAALK